ncbi:MAG: aromatic acid decarboxylase [Planctomycetota bacterium]|nr:MAG: aromatic acid decarboxylase [Planctomycetota bacterium]
MDKRIILALTGASGVLYGRSTLQALAAENVEIWLSISDAARLIVRDELKVNLDERNPDIEKLAGVKGVKYVPPHALDAVIASGSFPVDGMAIVPCSMSTLGAIASGHGTNVIHRAADVALKERRPLVLVPRETPFSAIHLENMLRLARAGATILPASPGFYHGPESVEDLVDFVVSRVLDALGIDNALIRRWGG